MNQPAARSLEYWASAKGRDLALIEGETCLTWSDWNELANLLAETLDRRGIGPDDVVAVRTLTRMEWAIIAAAIAKVGARLLTIDPQLSPRTVRDLMIDSSASALILDDSDPGPVGQVLAGLPLKLRASIDTRAPGFMSLADLFPPAARPRFASGFPALAIYTSTQPGRLQGASIPSRPAPAALQSRLPKGDDGLSLVTVSLSSVLGCNQVQLAIAAGRGLVFMRSFSPEEALALIAGRYVTEWTLSATNGRTLAALPTAIATMFDLSSLKSVTTMPGAIDHADRLRVASLLGPVGIVPSPATASGPITAMPPEASTGATGRRDGERGFYATARASGSLPHDPAPATHVFVRRPSVRQHS